MANTDLSPLIALVIQEVPTIIGLIKDLHRVQNPEAEPTDADVLAALQSALESSIAKDDQWLAAHPETP